MDQLHVLGNVALALLLGGLVGLEREIHDKPAGFRTHMIVAAAAALLVGLGDALVAAFAVKGGTRLGVDPIRIVQAIVMGIGFLGAGTIFQRHEKERIEGLTTAASLLLAGAIGIAVALGQILLAVGVTLLALLVLSALGAMEHRWRDRRHRTKERQKTDIGI